MLFHRLKGFQRVLSGAKRMLIWYVSLTMEAAQALRKCGQSDDLTCESRVMWKGILQEAQGEDKD